MKKFAPILLFWALALFFASPVLAQDTLEVFVLRVQFEEEKTDNSLTTGDGTFGSVPDKNYSLDPVKKGGSVHYWEQHLQFADSYFRAASAGKLVIRSRVFPVYTLKKQIIDYNRTSKRDGEKTAEYDEARSRDYLTFVYDAVATAAAADTSEASPFKVPLSKNPGVKRCYMIVHAGSSRLVDGGSMGTDGADTPGDFLDIYVSRDAWEYLLPDSAQSASAKPAFGVNDLGDTVVNGLLIPGSVIDTLRTVMVVSETASQDGLNWGVNGIVVNQIARELGLPNTYDVVKGISRLGYFDLMDFAGYSAGNGFMPALPAAWERSYMGWSNVMEVHPTAGHPVTVDIAAAGSGLGTEIVKVPLNGSEYLLIENRQRSWNEDGSVSVDVGDAGDDSGVETRTVPVDSLSLVFEDSVCTNGKCKENKKKAKGLIVGISSFDAGIPASGIAVWKVNDWYLRETVQYGVANFWGGDTLRDHQFGLSLIEADGILSIGKTFQNALGEDTYDYGSGSDLLPHLRVATSSTSSSAFKYGDTVKAILPTGYANTKTTQGGYTGVKISVNIPKNARSEKTSNAFMGDSVVNFVAPVISVTISIDDGSIEGSKFPRELGFNGAVRGTVFLDNPKDETEKILLVGAENGTVQAFSALGDTLFMSTADIRKKVLSVKDSEQYVPLYEVVDSSASRLIGLAGHGTNAVSLHENRMEHIHVNDDGVPSSSDSAFANGFKATAGPVLETENDGFKTWFAGIDANGNSWLKSDAGFSAELPEDYVVHDLALCQGKSGTESAGNYVVVGGIKGRLMVARPASKSDLENQDTWNLQTDERLNVACTDLDRDGTTDVVVVGSRGTFGYVPLTENYGKREFKVLKKQVFKRGATGSNGVVDETSGIAFGDINDDGYPEIVFLGDNLVYALDRNGVPLDNFPVTISRGTPVVGFFSDPLVVDVTGDNVPEILVPSSDGLVYAYTGKGKAVMGQFPLAAGSYEYLDTLGTIYPMSIFVTDAVGATKSSGPELYAMHRSSATAFRLQKAATDAAENGAAWTLPAGGNERTGYFDASSLKDVEESKVTDEIGEFFVYPNPVRGGDARVRFEIGNDASSAEVEFFDITGLRVFTYKMSNVASGRNETGMLDLRSLGSDVYTVRLKVKFVDGKTKKKLYRVGVIR